MNLGHPDRSARLEALAAEYALGTLSSRARRRLSRAARADPVVARAISAWETRLAAFAEAIPGVTPPPHVWTGIQRRLNLADTGAAGRAETGGWWANLGLWRGLAFAGFALAFALAVTLAPRPERAAEAIVVVLAAPDNKPALVATADRGAAYLTVKAVAPIAIAPDRALELWLLPPGADPRSLGLIPASGVGRVALASPAGIALQDIPALAVSLEPSGGSPTGKPTGPVLYSGGVQRMY